MNCAAALNLISSIDSLTEPPDAGDTGLIIKFVRLSPKESVSVDAAIKLFALFAAVPFVTR